MQDNESAILLQKNYPFSTGRGSKHVNIRYFFIVDKLAKKEVKILYCPNHEMITDYCSKPTQGVLFNKQRNKILGIHTEDFDKHKSWYKRTLENYDLWDDMEDNLMEL